MTGRLQSSLMRTGGVRSLTGPREPSSLKGWASSPRTIPLFGGGVTTRAARQAPGPGVTTARLGWARRRLCRAGHASDEGMWSCPTPGSMSPRTSGTTRFSTAATPWTATRATIRSTGGSPRRTGGPPAMQYALNGEEEFGVARRTARRGGAGPQRRFRRGLLGRECDRPEGRLALRAGRRPTRGPGSSVARDEDTDDIEDTLRDNEAERVARDTGIDGGGASAEEAAVHLIGDRTTKRRRRRRLGPRAPAWPRPPGGSAEPAAGGGRHRVEGFRREPAAAEVGLGQRGASPRRPGRRGRARAPSRRSRRRSSSPRSCPPRRRPPTVTSASGQETSKSSRSDAWPSVSSDPMWRQVLFGRPSRFPRSAGGDRHGPRAVVTTCRARRRSTGSASRSARAASGSVRPAARATAPRGPAPPPRTRRGAPRTRRTPGRA